MVKELLPQIIGCQQGHYGELYICISEGHNSTIFVNKAELSIMLEELYGFRLVQTEVFAVETPLIQVLVSPNR